MPGLIKYDGEGRPGSSSMMERVDRALSSTVRLRIVSPPCCSDLSLCPGSLPACLPECGLAVPHSLPWITLRHVRQEAQHKRSLALFLLLAAQSPGQHIVRSHLPVCAAVPNHCVQIAHRTWAPSDSTEDLGACLGCGRKPLAQSQVTVMDHTLPRLLSTSDQLQRLGAAPFDGQDGEEA